MKSIKCAHCDADVQYRTKPTKRCPDCGNFLKPNEEKSDVVGDRVAPAVDSEATQAEAEAPADRQDSEVIAQIEEALVDSDKRVEAGGNDGADIYENGVIEAALKEKVAALEKPDWEMVLCEECGTELGKRPKGHKISSALCPNRENHQIGLVVRPGEVVEAPPPEVTTDLPPYGYPIPNNLAEILNSSSSGMGYSAVSQWLNCPERSRLRSMGLRKKTHTIPVEDGVAPLHELKAYEFGSYIHALLGIRAAHGQEMMEQAHDWYKQWMLAEDALKALNLLLTYNSVYPLEQEPFKYLGLEVEVKSEVTPGVIRSVRYDGLIQFTDGTVGSLEYKTASRAGLGSLSQYNGQFMTQMVVWNSNESLVSKYGKMRAIIATQLVKTAVPQVERHAIPFAEHHMKLVREYLSLPDLIAFPKMADGSYPKMLHSCWGKYEPCPYISYCHEGMVNEYEVPES